MKKRAKEENGETSGAGSSSAGAKVDGEEKGESGRFGVWSLEICGWEGAPPGPLPTIRNTEMIQGTYQT